MFDFQQMYREKLRTPEAAVECVKDGDWVDYTSSLGKPDRKSTRLNSSHNA